MTWPNSRRRVVACALAVSSTAWFASTLTSTGLARSKEAAVAPSSGELDSPGAGLSKSPSSSPQRERDGSPQAIARTDGRGVPGQEVRLLGGESRGVQLQYRWIQVRGPVVKLEGADRSEASFKVPRGSNPLGFVLVVTGSAGSDTAEVNLPIEVAPTGAVHASLSADAGDDQIGLVGQQVTLNGSRSEPRGQLGFRWIQTGGPVVRFKLEEGYIHSFVPPAPGVYRFSLVVALDSTISSPDEVVVRVGSGLRGGGPVGDESEVSKAPKGPQVVPTQELARAGLAGIRGGVDAAEPLAKVFEDTAHRMSVYETYAEAFSEMSRRFEEILPSESARRQRWMDRIFQPLTTRTLEVLRAEGLDLLKGDAPDATLDDAQKAALAEQFQLIAEGFRSVTSLR